MTTALHKLQTQRIYWQLLCLALTLLAFILASAIVNAAANVQIKIKPLSSATTAPMSLASKDTQEFQGSVEDLLSKTALSDLYLILNYTPDTVVAQTERFITRLTPSTRQTRTSELLVQANTAREANFSLRFDLIEVKDGISVSFPSSPDQPYTVKLAGNLIRLRNGIPPIRVTTSYVLSYLKAPNGVFYVDSVRTLSK